MSTRATESSRFPTGQRIAVGVAAVAIVTSISAVFGLEHAAEQLRERTDALSREIADRIRPRPPIPGATGAASEMGDIVDEETSAFELYTGGSRRLDAATVEPLAEAYQNGARPDDAATAAALAKNAGVIEDMLTAARHPYGGNRRPAEVLDDVDVFEHLNLGHLMRTAALATPEGEGSNRRVALWSTAFQHARDLGDHTSMLLTLVGSAILDLHCSTLAESLTEHPMPPDEARRLAGFLIDLTGSWPDPGGAFLREAEWIGRRSGRVEIFDHSRLYLWRHGFSWTLALSAGLERQLAIARIIDPLLSQPFDVVQARLRSYETSHAPDPLLAMGSLHDRLTNMLAPLVRVRLAIGMLRLHAGDPLGELASPFRGTIRYEPATDTALATLICPAPPGEPELRLELPASLTLPGAAEHR